MPFAVFDEAREATTAHRLSRRRWVETLLDLAGHLDRRDRLIIEQVYRHGVPMTDVAALTGQPARNMHRHVAGLIRRMRDPLFAFVAEAGDLLPRHTRAVARRVILRGQSQRLAADELGLKLHQVRLEVQLIHAMHRLTRFPRR